MTEQEAFDLLIAAQHRRDRQQIERVWAEREARRLREQHRAVEAPEVLLDERILPRTIRR
jgi:serine/threonine-protein kinase RIO1